MPQLNQSIAPRSIRCAVAIGFLLLGSIAQADEPPETAEARRLFLHGAELVKTFQWSEALAFFEQSARLHPDSGTTYNVGACQRALGQYTRARGTLRRALAESEANGRQLPENLRSDALGFLDQIEQLLAHAIITIDPPEAAIALDGRPLEVVSRDTSPPVVVAGILAPGPGTPAPFARFELVLDPGAHVLTLSRKGFTNIVRNQSFVPGSKVELPLLLTRLPALIHVKSTQENAIVTVNKDDVGPVPAHVSRPAGSYHVVVKKEGFVSYQADVTVNAGEESELRAALEVYKAPIYKRWWFWTAIGAVLVGGAALTYALTVKPPPYDGGNTGWVVMPSR